ncbi:MAG: hypothetical protein WB586_21580 [Chthoniobacterales bacterium]
MKASAKRNVQYAELAPVLCRLESALAIERQTLAGFLSNLADEFEMNHKDVAYQAIIVDHERAGRDTATSKSPKDFYRRLEKWVGPAWRGWIEETTLGPAQGPRQSGAKRASIRLRPDRPGIEGALAVTRSERIRCSSKVATDAPCDTQVLKPDSEN